MEKIKNSEEYLKVRKRQDELLAEIPPSGPLDEKKVEELFALEGLCHDFEGETFHKDFVELNFELHPRQIIEIIRFSHQSGMNVSDFVSMLVVQKGGFEDDFSWTTDIRDAGEAGNADNVITIPEEVLKGFGLQRGDFVKITASKDSISVRKWNFTDDEGNEPR